MKATLALIAMLALTSCAATLRKIGETVCNSQESISAQLTEAGDLLASVFPPVKWLTGGANILLKAGCKAFDVVVTAPGDLTDELGITGDETPAPPPAPPPAGDDG